MSNSQDAMDWTPGEACRHSAEICDSQDIDCAIVILLDRGKDGGYYNTMIRQSGLSRSEMIALLDSAKYDIHKAMKG